MEANCDSKKNETKCIGCSTTLRPDHIGIRCPNSHDICADCAKAFISTVLDDPQSKIPVKCMMCNAEVIPLTFERQLDSEQKDLYMIYSA